MSDNTAIEWTEATWNPVTGCTRISTGCKNCYAERLARRLQAMGCYNYRNGFEVTLQPRMLRRPFAWKRPRRVFVNSMSDLFHDDVPASHIRRVFQIMNTANWHEYQVLTKRSKRLSQVASTLAWSTNIWMGVSVESKAYTFRIDHLRNTPAAIKFVSFEPLLGSITEVDLAGIDWVIVGGESGPRARSMQETWVLEILDHCRRFGVPFFFKQWGGIRRTVAGRLLKGRTWDEYPQGSDTSRRVGDVKPAIASMFPFVKDGKRRSSQPSGSQHTQCFSFQER